MGDIIIVVLDVGKRIYSGYISALSEGLRVYVTRVSVSLLAC